MNNTIEGYRTSAERFRNAVNTAPKSLNKAEAKALYIDYLKCQIENSTRANIAMNEMYKKHPAIFPMTFEANMAQLERVPEIDTLTKTLTEKYSRLYPKTGALRERLIRSERVVFDEVRPALKGFGKKLLKLFL